jgi:hypothetical protein
MVPFAQSQAISPNLDPLTPEEKRIVLRELDELENCRQKIKTKDALIDSERSQCEKEKEASAKLLDAEKRSTEATIKERDLAIKERDLARDQASTWETMYKVATKKPSMTCRILSGIFTLGIYRCKP